MTKVAVLDYGVGNVRSIMNALATLDCETSLTSDRDVIESSDKLIIPGVGAFAYCMVRLRASQLDLAIKAFAQSGKPLLGICVGMQMLFENSEEHGEHAGLGLLPGRVQRLPVAAGNDIRLPHIGWTQVEYARGRSHQSVFATLPADSNYYFVHSFACSPGEPDHCLAQTRYADVTFAAAVIKDNICGVQFHPERSGKAGLALLENFVSTQ
jgi:glutamine amidotransferase